MYLTPELVRLAVELLDSDDERAVHFAMLMCEARVEARALTWTLPPPREAPPCPDCGRRFDSSLRTGRWPLHGPRAARCSASGEDLPSLWAGLPLSG